MRASSASTFTKMSPTRRVARSEWATTTSTSSMGDQYPGTVGHVAGIIASDERRRPVPSGP
jgi:hypothetical protein